jgi:hypothetical protein
MRTTLSLTRFCAEIASLPATAVAATLPFTSSSYNVNPSGAPAHRIAN